MNRNGNGRQQEQKSSKPKPIGERRDRTLQGTIWANAFDNGNSSGEMLNVTLKKGWRDEQGNWHDTQSFSLFDDVPRLILLLQELYRLGLELHRNRREEAREADGSEGRETQQDSSRSGR